jgi:hypothetical protein
MSRQILAIAIAAAAAAGCTDNRSSIEILARAAPDSIPSCKFAAGGEFLGGPGQLFVGGAVRTYDAFLYVNNTLEDPTKASSSTVKSAKTWRALAAKVRVNPSDYLSKFPPSPDLLNYSADARLPLDGSGIEPNTNGIQFVSIIPQVIGDGLNGALGGTTSGSVVVGVTLEGQTLDGASLDSGEWYFTLRVCTGAGCLIPLCKAGDVVVGCFGAQQDPLGCTTP